MKIGKNRFNVLCKKNVASVLMGLTLPKKLSPDDTSRCSPCTHTPPASWAAAPRWRLPRPRFYILIIFAHKAPLPPSASSGTPTVSLMRWRQGCTGTAPLLATFQFTHFEVPGVLKTPCCYSTTVAGCVIWALFFW
jgi:hypothetical protein